ncbi:MAG: alpha/beta hydrolase [Pseudomonadota bacterium]
MNFLLGAVLFYAGLTAFLYVYQRNMLYFPGGPRPQIEADIAPQTIAVTPEEGIDLEGWYWPAEQGFPTIVFFHGNGQAYQYWVNKLSVYREQGYGAYFTDYRGYGGFPGKPTEEGIYQDARSFIRALKEERGIAEEDMIFYGESLGTGVAIQMATEFAPKALVLESAYSATSDVAKSRYWMFPVDLLMKDQFRSIDKIGALTMPKFFIHGAEDQIIPVKFSQKLFDAAPESKELKIIPNAEHNNQYDHGAALHISAFLSKITSDQQ